MNVQVKVLAGFEEKKLIKQNLVNFLNESVKVH